MAFIPWLFAAESESHMMVMMELMMKERNMFLWREILWQLRLLEETTDNRKKCKVFYSLQGSNERVAAATWWETVFDMSLWGS